MNRFEQWMATQFEGSTLPIPMLIRRIDTGIIVFFSQTPQEEWSVALGQLLSEEWQCSVTLDGYAWDHDPIKRVWQIWSITGANFSQTLSRDCLAFEDNLLQCKFPSGMIRKLFESWGGIQKLRQFWPEMPDWHMTVAEVAPAPADPIIPVESRMQDAGVSGKIGKGCPESETVSLKTLPNFGEVIVLGRILSRDMRLGRDGQRHFSWLITDNESAVKLRYSERRGQHKLAEASFPEGQWIKTRGVIEMDKFLDEYIIRIKDAGVFEIPEMDYSGSRPRIELHMHSKMSTMDSILSLNEGFHWAKKHNMPALAMVDHSVVQTYPEAEVLGKKTGVRPIYGVEVNMVDDVVSPLTGPSLSRPFPETPWVVVDVETTGLSPLNHEIIEIGAVKIVGGTIVDTFHSMVAPSRSVSQATWDITGITQRELDTAPPAEEVFARFFAFAEGSVLAAHNARFDMGFLSTVYRKINSNKAWPFAILDTLALARVLLPGLKGYGLGHLTNFLKIPLSQHHRALADAEATGLLLLKLLSQDRSWDSWTEEELCRPMSLAYNIGRPQPVVLLTKTQEGIEELYRLVSTSHLDSFYRVPRVRRSWIDAGRKHWFVGSPIHQGEMAEMVFREAMDWEIEPVAGFYDYWEIAPPSGLNTMLSEGYLGDLETVKSYLHRLIDLGKKYNKVVVAVSDAHYLTEKDQIFRTILAKTAKSELHDAADAMHMRTAEEMDEAFAFLSPGDREAVIYSNPDRLVSELEHVKPVPDGLFAPKLAEAEKVVSEMPIQRAQALYGQPIPDIVSKRLQKEIHSIVTNGFSSIYYIAHRLVKRSLDDGYLVGSRGSVGSSLVATFMDITEVSPLPPHYRCPQCQYNEFILDEYVGSGFDLPRKTCPRCQTVLIGDGQDIPFETFLGFEGDKVPDIDLNFSGEYQPNIHKYTEELFGQGHVFRAGTIATIAEKTAFGLVKAWARETGDSLRNAEIEWLALGITGVKRTTGQHPGGLMVVPSEESIYHFTPVQRPADDRKSEVVTTHFDYHAIEGRLLKLDLLGHDDPTAIRMLEDLTGISPSAVPFQDAETMSLFHSPKALGVGVNDIKTSVGTLGIPEFGTWFVRNMLEATKPETFSELVRISGLSHGTEVWTNNAQDLIRHNVANLSQVIATRDDIMTYLLNRKIEPKKAFAISESVRKGKGLKPDQESLMKEHNVPNWYIDSCRKISYLFPKAHAAAYVMMGWRIAWFKVHHPLAFYATYFSVRASDFDPLVVLGGIPRINQAMADIEDKGNEATAKDKNLSTVLEIAREMWARGLRFAPVDLMASDSARFLVQDKDLLIPFASLPGLGTTAAENIVRTRQDGPFLSIADLRERAHLSRSIIDLLREHGALDGLGETSQLAFF